MAMPDSGDSSDRTDLERCRQGDGAGLENLYRRYSPKVYGLALRMLRRPDAAEDVVQETVLAVHRGGEGFRGGSRVGTWIYAIALNACRMRLRSERRRAVPLEEASAVAAPLPRESSGALLEALAALEPETREIVLLSAQGRSYEEMGELLELTVDQVRGRLYRGRKALLDRMREREHAEF
jgi:RNA polymerase sigma-70 factor (ECF subfamily)